MILSAKNITKNYPIGKNQNLEILKGISLDINEAEIVAIVGPSGAGKSTLLHILGLLDRPSSGELWYEGKNISKENDETLSVIRNKNIGFVFQFHHLLPEFTALENVMIPAYIFGIKNLHETQLRAQELLNEVGLTDRLHHKPSELSGGEQQRVAVARALMNNPKLILADEPSGNLDTENAVALHNLIFRLREKFKQSFVIVTHNNAFSEQADRKITLLDGRIS